MLSDLVEKEMKKLKSVLLQLHIMLKRQLNKQLIVC